jgi:hypothetical protein
VQRKQQAGAAGLNTKMNVLRYSASLRIGVIAAAIVVGLVLAMKIQQTGASLLEIVIAYSAAGLYILDVLAVIRTKVILDEQKVTYVTMSGSTTFEWDEIEDVYQTPHMLFLTPSMQRKRMRFMKGEFGLSLEPFDALHQEVIRRLTPRLQKKWSKERLPKKFASSGIHFGMVVAYSLPIMLLGIFFILFLTVMQGMLIATLLFLLVSLLVVLPFLLRDYRLSMRQLTIEEEGLRETNGDELFMPWQAVRMILVKEGYIGGGSVLIEGEGPQTIKLAPTHRNIGQILYLIKQKSQCSEVYGHE